jgi:diguanylate cyclase (GGDEF)-like protein
MTIEQPARHNSVRFAVTALSLGVVYFLADFALNHFGFEAGWTILWPLNGITIALLIRNPRSRWLALLLGIEVGTGVGELFADNSLVSVIWQRLLSLSEVVISAAFLPAFSNLSDWLRKPRIFPRFLAALFLGPLISGVFAAIYFHITIHEAYLAAFDDWAAADALGIAVVMPLALSLSSADTRNLFRRGAILKTLLTLTISFAGAALALSVQRYPLLFLLYPILLLVDSLLAFSGSSIAVAGISLLAVYLTTHSIGPFGYWPHDLAVSRDVALQLFLGFQLVALFPASVLIMERRRMAIELRKTNSQLLLLASIDGLTGISNRRSLDERFQQEWNRAIRTATPLAFLMIDIDHFKQFNDLYGHHAGDRCLQTVAATLREELQRTQDHLARFGGEEFAMLLPNTDLAGAMHLGEQVRAAVIAQAIDHRGSPLGQVSISIGCASLVPALDQDPVVLLQMADEALYQAKRNGRNRVEGVVPMVGA